MTHRLLDWPPFQRAFVKLDSRKRGQESKTEEAVDIVQSAPDGVRVSPSPRRDGTFTFHLAGQGPEILQLCLQYRRK